MKVITSVTLAPSTITTAPYDRQLLIFIIGAILGEKKFQDSRI
jgi:hypothetical protein